MKFNLNYLKFDYIYNQTQYIFFKEMYYNPNIVYKLLFLYRRVLVLLFIFCFIKNNLIFLENFLDVFLYYYVQELNESFVHMDSLDNNNPYGEGSSNNVPEGTGPPGNNSTGLESAAENENTKKRKRKSTTEKKSKKKSKTKSKAYDVSPKKSQKKSTKKVRFKEPSDNSKSKNTKNISESDDSKMKNIKYTHDPNILPKLTMEHRKNLAKLKRKYHDNRVKGLTGYLPHPKSKLYAEIMSKSDVKPKMPFKMNPRKVRQYRWPAFRYLDKDLGKWIYPEKYHSNPPVYLGASNTMRMYEDGGIRYTYFTQHFKDEDRYCKIRYHDGTSLYMYDKARVLKHIEFNRWNTYLGYTMRPRFILSNYLKQHFDVFRSNKVKKIWDKAKGN